MTYEYKCKKCGILEVQQKMSEDTLEECPRCGMTGEENKEDFQKICSGGSGFVLDGSGWARTGYQREEADY
jgi:putative FmdB family regulatory protein